MKRFKKNVFKYDTINGTYLINDKEVDEDTWIKAKSTWEIAASYNHLKRYTDKYGYTDCQWYIENNVCIWVFTTENINFIF